MQCVIGAKKIYQFKTKYKGGKDQLFVKCFCNYLKTMVFSY